jgi:hypothetical protein
MDRATQMTLTFRCLPALEKILPQPMPAVQGLPDWFKSLPARNFNPTMGKETETVKKCPPFIDAMTYGFLIPLVTDLEVCNGEFSWDFAAEGLSDEFPHSPLGFHDSSQAAGTPFFDEDRFIIKFNNFWNIEAPEGYSLLCTHPVNRTDLPFTTLTGLVDADTFNHSPLAFPAHWHDTSFNGVLPKGTPVAQLLPVRRENWIGRCEVLSGEAVERMLNARHAMRRETDVYRHQFRAPKR